MSFSSCASSSSIVAMAEGPPLHHARRRRRRRQQDGGGVEPIQHGDWMQFGLRLGFRWDTGGLRVPPSPGFSQVLILKIVKVLYFDTLLQVLILNVVSRRRFRRPFGK